MVCYIFTTFIQLHRGCEGNIISIPLYVSYVYSRIYSKADVDLTKIVIILLQSL